MTDFTKCGIMLKDMNEMTEEEITEKMTEVEDEKKRFEKDDDQVRTQLLEVQNINEGLLLNDLLSFQNNQ